MGEGAWADNIKMGCVGSETALGCRGGLGESLCRGLAYSSRNLIKDKIITLAESYHFGGCASGACCHVHLEDFGK